MAYCGLISLVGRLVGEALLGAPAVDLLPPFLQARRLFALYLARLPDAHHRRDAPWPASATMRQVDADVLVDLRGVDVEMDLLRARREGVDAPGHAVVEARAQADHQVAIVHRVVGFVGAVHAQHAEPVRPRGGIGAEPHQRGGDRKAGQLDQFAQRCAGRRPGIDDAAAGVEDRPLGLRHQLHRLARWRPASGSVRGR